MLTLCLFLQFEFVDYRACFLRRCVYFLVNPPTHVPVGLQQLSLAPLPLFYTKMFSSLREKKKKKKISVCVCMGFLRGNLVQSQTNTRYVAAIYTHTRAIYPPTYTYFYVTTDITIRVQGVVCMILIFFPLPQTKQKPNFSTLFLLK